MLTRLRDDHPAVPAAEIPPVTQEWDTGLNEFFEHLRYKALFEHSQYKEWIQVKRALEHGADGYWEENGDADQTY